MISELKYLRKTKIWLKKNSIERNGTHELVAFER